MQRKTCNSDPVAHEAENIYYLALSRKFADLYMDQIAIYLLIYLISWHLEVVSRLWVYYKGGCCVHSCAYRWVNKCMHLVVHA